MAFSSLFWRCFMVVLLIGIPNIRTHVFQNSDEDLADRIVKQISQGQGQGQGHSQTSIDKPIKKEGINLESKDSSAPGPDPPADPPKVQPTSTPKHAPPGNAQPQMKEEPQDDDTRLLSRNDTKFAIFVCIGVVAGFVGLMIAGVCYYKFRKNAKAASEVEYPAYGVTGPMKERVPSPGDRKLAQSAQMYHYQHQKQQMIAMEKANGDMKHDASDDDSEEDNVEGDYTVYECPGLAPTGEMEVKNPLFRGDESAMTPGQENNPPASQGEGEQ